MSGRFLHFAYASNMLRERMLCYNRHALKVFKCPAKLQNYTLAFCRDWPFPGKWYGPTATIRKHTGSHVWGVVWELEEKIKVELDNQESTHIGFNVDVSGADGKTYTCWTYAMNEGQGQEEKPSPQYKDIIIRGAQQSKLPDDYIECLKHIEDSGYSGRVQVYEDIIKILNEGY